MRRGIHNIKIVERIACYNVNMCSLYVINRMHQTSSIQSPSSHTSQSITTNDIKLTISAPHNSHTFTILAKEGDNLYTLAQESEELRTYLECTCSGIAACSTCHIILQEDDFKTLGEPDECEKDMIDLAWGSTDTSRLGCQLTITKKCDGMTFTIPENVNDLH